jgi:hypothetical protein
MPRAERPSCSSLSRALGEETVATASRFRFWLMVEQPGPWGHDALVESGFPADVGAALAAAGRRLGIRVLLVKQRDVATSPRRRCFAAFTGRRERRLQAFEVDRPEELLDLDLPRLVRGRFRAVGRPWAEPLFLVCTHGKHDPCCARHGAPLYRALAAGEEGAWECTHIGGDRFAGNLVCFPHGLYYGRVAPSDGPVVAAAYRRGEIALDLYRGRSAYPPAVQAAEHHVRRQTGILGVDAVEVVGHRARGSIHEVDLAAAGTRYTVEVEVGLAHARPLTCKSLHPHRPRALEIRSARTA